MLATLSPEATVGRILDELNCPPTNFSEIADRHATSRVLAGLKGNNDFSPEDGQYYLPVARQMRELAKEFPVPIDWRQTRIIKELLAARRTQTRPTPFSVIVVGDKLFKRVENGAMITTTSFKDCAGFTNELVALEAARLLDNLSSGSMRITTITNQVRAPETISDRLVDFGFES